MSGFTLINRPKKGSKRQSSLFKLMQEDETRWRGLIEIPERRIKTPNSYIPAYLIDLEHGSAKNIYSDFGYKMYDRHIRIDEEFGAQNSVLANKKLCTHWHYTERFKKGNDTITIHAYYHYNTMLGVYKRINDGDNLRIEDEILLDAIRQNSLPARNIVHKLIDLLKQERAAAESQYNNIINQVPDIQALGLKSIDALQKHLAQCKAASERLNDLIEDYSDVRIKLIERNVNLVIAFKQSESVKKTTDILEETTVSALEAMAVATTSDMPEKIKKETVKKRDLQQEINELEKAYKNADVAKLLELDPKKQDLYIELVAQYFESNDTDSSRSSLLGLETRLLALPKLVDVLMQKSIASDAVAIRLLYPAIDSNEISDEFYLGLLCNVMGKEFNDQQELEFAELLKFLYIISDKYRLLITYIIHFGYMQNSSEAELAYSYLFMLFLDGAKNNTKHAIFKCLIDQIGDIQQWGMIYGKHNVSLLTAVASRDTDGKVIEFLLSKRIVDSEEYLAPELKLVKSYSELRSYKDKDALSRFFPEDKLKSEIALATKKTDSSVYTNKAHYVSHFASIKSSLFAYSVHDATSNIKVYTKLIDTSSDLGIFLCLSSIIARCRLIMLPSWDFNNRYKLFQENNKRMQQVNEKVSKIQNDGASTGADCLEFYLVPQKHDAYEFINAALKLLTAKTATLSYDRIMQVYEQCIRNGIEAGCAKNNQLSLTCYYAALHALNSAMPQTAEVHQKIFKLFGRLILVHKQDTDSQFIGGKEGYIMGHEGALDNMKLTSKFRDALNADGASKAPVGLRNTSC